MTTRRDLLRSAALIGTAGALTPLMTPHQAAAAGAGQRAQAAGPPAAGAAESPTAQGTKQESTYYTTEKVAAARRNIEDFAWAQELRDTAVAAADTFLAQGDDWLWHLVTGQRLPRSYAVNQFLGSPISGRDIYRTATTRGSPIHCTSRGRWSTRPYRRTPASPGSIPPTTSPPSTPAAWTSTALRPRARRPEPAGQRALPRTRTRLGCRRRLRLGRRRRQQVDVPRLLPPLVTCGIPRQTPRRPPSARHSPPAATPSSTPASHATPMPASSFSTGSRTSTRRWTRASTSVRTATCTPTG